MRIELIPLILGVLVALLGAGMIFDAWSPDGRAVPTERRRRPRVERHRGGEALIGFGVLALAGAFIGRDTWRFTTLVVIVGAAFLVLGTALNFAYVRELYVNRGPLRRRQYSRNDDVIATHVDSAAPTPSADSAVDQVIDRETADPRPTQRPPPDSSSERYSGVERRSHPRGNRRP